MGFRSIATKICGDLQRDPARILNKDPAGPTHRTAGATEDPLDLSQDLGDRRTDLADPERDPRKR